MLFPTLTFGLFFLALFAIVWLQKGNEWRKIVLLAGSWIFYGAWDWRFVALLIASAVGNWAIGWQVAGARGTGTGERVRQKAGPPEVDRLSAANRQWPRAQLSVSARPCRP